MFKRKPKAFALKHDPLLAVLSDKGAGHMLTQISIGGVLIVTTVLIHAISLELIMRAVYSFPAHVLARWRMATLALVVFGVFVAHVLEVWVWAVFYFLNAAIEAIPTLEAAFYFSTSTFTTVGFGDLVLTERWRLLSSIESINGMILFGWSTAFIFEVYRLVSRQAYSAREPRASA